MKSTKDELEEMARLRATGLSYARVGEIVGLSGQVVRRRLNPDNRLRELEQARERYRDDHDYRDRIREAERQRRHSKPGFQAREDRRRRGRVRGMEREIDREWEQLQMDREYERLIGDELERFYD